MRVLLAALLLLPLVARAADETMGTAQFFGAVAVAPDGHWSVVDEKREGGVQRYFVEGRGAGERIDQLIGRDDAGRFVLLQVGAKVLLVDTMKHERNLILEAADASSVNLGQISLDAEGLALSYPRKGDAVVRSLATGEEHVIKFGGQSWAARLAPGGMFLVAREADPGDPAVMPSWLNVGGTAYRCHESVLIDRGRPVVFSIRSGRLYEGFIYARGDTLVRRNDRAIELVRNDAVTTLVPASCDARVRWVDVARRTAAVECRAAGQGSRGVASIRLFGRRDERLLKMSSSDEETAPEDGRFFESETYTYDAVTGRTFQLRGGSVVAYEGRNVLTERSDRTLFVFRDDAPEASTPLGVRNERGDRAVQRGSLVAIGGHVVDLAHASVLGHYEGQALAMGKDGRILALDHDGWIPKGPLVWRTVTPLSAH